MSYLRYLCLFAYGGVQHILCCVFVLFFLVLSMLSVSLDCHFLLLLRFCLTLSRNILRERSERVFFYYVSEVRECSFIT